MPVHAVVVQVGRGAVTKTILHHNNIMIIQQETTIMYKKYIETEERVSLMSCCNPGNFCYGCSTVLTRGNGTYLGVEALGGFLFPYNYYC